MSFGAYIMLRVGDSNKFDALPPELMGAVTEVRVEQHLDKQASFAVRFEEDFQDDEARIATEERFRQATGVAIAVPNGPDSSDLVCLIRGQIENTEFHVDPGGAGSWFEIRGQDVRTLVNRNSEPQSYEGDSGALIQAMAELFTTETPDVGEASVVYDGDKYSFNFRGTVLDGLGELAKVNNFHFWLSYPIEPDFIFSSMYEVGIQAHVKPSPPRGSDEKPGPPDLGLLAKDDTPRLMILGDADECETVINFKVRSDSEAPSEVMVHAQSQDSGETTAATVKSEQDAMNEGPKVDDVGGAESSELEKARQTVRRAFVGGPGDPEEVESRAKAAATEASWFIGAEAMTTAHMLGSVLQPHDIVEVVGAGCSAAGTYQVSSVTHVINPAEHYMNLELRTNASSQK